MKNEHLISVVIPVYNRAWLIEESVRSVLSQTCQDFEIVIVDDGSKDATPAVLERLVKGDRRIKCLQHPVNRGAQAARNTGIRAARGRWIAFLDSDDRWLRESLEVRLQLASERCIQVVHSECEILYAGSAVPERFGTPAMTGSIYRQLLQKPGPTFPSLLVSKEALVRIGYLDETIVAYQEWDTAIRLARYYEFAFVPEPTFVYDCRYTDSISKDSARDAVGYERVFTKHRWSVIRNLGPRALAFHYQSAAQLYSKANDANNARRCLMNAFLLWPFRPGAILRRASRFFRPAL